jgi:hypothetical protein
MADTPTQNYANHVHRPTLSGVAGLAALVAFGLAVRLLLQEGSMLHATLLLLAVAAMTLTLISRNYIVRLQDRIIRLEMQARLERVGKGSALGALSMKQVTALRFASDAELPGLVDRALAEQLTPDQIKRAVKDWQPDWLRT